MLIFLYNLFFPIVFLFFLPGLIIKLIKRDGYKKTYWERFGIFKKEVKNRLKKIPSLSPIWVHAVSVGETQLAIDFIKTWMAASPEKRFILSTTTITGQAMARKNAPKDVEVVYCPIDFIFIVARFLNLVHPVMLVIFETEIWPNMIYLASKKGIKVVQVNARISDKSLRGYTKFNWFIKIFLSKLSISCAQTELDVQRLKIICPELKVVQTGTMKFDQNILDKHISAIDLKPYFGTGNFKVLLAASTHSGEEKLIAKIFAKIKKEFPLLKLIIVPRHAERGSDIASVLRELQIHFAVRSQNIPITQYVDCLLADTTGEMQQFIRASDIVIMGNSFASNDGGHNIIEPAILGKPVITGKILKNFREVLSVMLENNAVITAADEELEFAVKNLLTSPEKCKELSEKAREAVLKQKGAIPRTISILEKVLLG